MERCATPESVSEEQIDVTTVSPVKSVISPVISDCRAGSPRALDLSNVSMARKPNQPIASQAPLQTLTTPLNPLQHVYTPMQSTPERPLPNVPNYFSSMVVTQVKEMARQQHLQLQQELSTMQQHQLLSSTAKHLEEEYNTAVNQMETSRYQTLIYNLGNELCKQMTNSYYDHEWLMLIQRTRQQVSLSTSASKLPTTQAKNILNYQTPTNNQQAVYSLPPTGHLFHQPTQPIAYQTMTPTRISATHNTSSTSSTSTESPLPNSDTSSIFSPSSSSPTTTDSAASDSTVTPPAAQGRRRYLNTRAVMILTDWYCQHFDHPYPNDTELVQLATAGGITIPQVKKWMANKRVRSYNTLAFNGSIHPKKLERLQRENTARARAGLPLEVPTCAKPNHQRKPNTRLSNETQQILNKWYEQHIDHPYPTEEEKEALANQGGVTLKQLKYWFANKRSRSNIGKKENSFSQDSYSQLMLSSF